MTFFFQLFLEASIFSFGPISRLFEKSCHLQAYKLSNTSILDVRGKHGLHMAVSNGFLDIAKYLLGKGASKNLIDKYGRSPLHWAALNRHIEIVKELIKSGVKVWYDESGNWQPIHEAVKSGDVKIAQILIDHGSPVNNPDPQGMPL